MKTFEYSTPFSIVEAFIKANGSAFNAATVPRRECDGASVLHIALPKLQVNTRLRHVRHRGKVYDLTSNQAKLLKALVGANGDWVSMSGLGIKKPSEAKNNLPEAIKQLIETESGKGYRLKRL